jgi:hypothetical protein
MELKFIDLKRLVVNLRQSGIFSGLFHKYDTTLGGNGDKDRDLKSGSESIWETWR